MTRLIAALIHASISLTAFLILAYFVLELWYPDFFFATDGGWQGMRILIGVDLVLGPILTFVVFKRGKPGLSFDLTLIGIVQATCLAAGIFIVYSQRPIFFVYYEKHFYTASASSFTEYGLQTPDYRQYADKAPAAVYVKPPESPIEEADLRRILYQDGIPLWAYSPLYRPIAEHMGEIVLEGISESDLQDRDSESLIESFIETHGGEFDDYAFIVINSRYQNGFLAIRKSDKSFVDVITVDKLTTASY